MSRQAFSGDLESSKLIGALKLLGRSVGFLNVFSAQDENQSHRTPDMRKSRLTVEQIVYALQQVK